VASASAVVFEGREGAAGLKAAGRISEGGIEETVNAREGI